ncbi:hypothetical protein [Argonema galeatum]|uniref:hypothetical protein n=1 Tax=Argonema galeatum TaxID=2942762 RepID=UPI002011FE58|nr:hypothetical protein [Argonema galeatum]
MLRFSALEIGTLLRFSALENSVQAQQHIELKRTQRLVVSPTPACDLNRRRANSEVNSFVYSPSQVDEV